MPEILPFLREANGIVREWHTNPDGTYTVVSRQENESNILEHNKARFNHDDGYTSKTRDMQRVASIPALLLEHWQNVEGWNPFAPENANKLAAKLDSSEFLWLRSAPGRLGRKHRHI